MTRLRSRRGLTMMIALTLLVLAAAALVAMAQLVRDDAGRTLDEWRSAQLRSLLLAGRDRALAELDAGRAVDHAEIPLPSELADARLALDAHADNDVCSLTVRAVLDQHPMTGEFELQRSGNAWLVRAATLDPQ